MKVTVECIVRGSYVDGANTGTYKYMVAKKAFTILAKNLWMLRAFSLTKNAVSKAIVAYALTTTGGAPPAFGTRTITIASNGAITFTDVKETLYMMELVCTISDCEDHPYEIMSCMIPSHDMTGTLKANGNSGMVAVSEDEWISNDTFIADAAYASLELTFTGTGITTPKLLPCSVVVAETDLVMREYTGQYIELGAKALVSMGQIAGKRFEGLAAQAMNYLQSGSSPLALELTLNNHPLAIGEGI